MLIDCPACARSYHVSRAEIGAEGRDVICPRCDASWFVDGDGNPRDGSHDTPVTIVSRRPDPSDRAAEPAPRASLWRPAWPLALAVTGVVIAMALLGARERVVRLLPRTAGLYAALGLPVNVRGLELAAVTSMRADAAPSDVTVSGQIRNVTQKRVGVPRLTYEIRDAAGAPLVTWTEHAGARTLAVGRTLAFVSSPHRLPRDAHSVLVRFEDEDVPVPMRLAHRAAH